MFILNGIVYASERPENIEVTQATPLEEHDDDPNLFYW